MKERKLTEKEIDYMRADMETDYGYTKFILATQKRFKEQGRDFQKEFEEWKKKKKKKEDV